MKSLSLLIFSIFIFGIPAISIAQVNLEDGLIAYYPFNGNAHDESSNGHNGVVSGCTLVSDRFGNSNSAYLFDGHNDYIEIADHSDLRLGNSYAISLWFFVNDFSNVNTHAFLSKRNGTTNEGYMFQIIGNDHLAAEPQGRISLIAGTSNANIPSSNEMTSGEWIHVVVQSDAEEGKSQVYINSELNNENLPVVSNILTSANLFIGKDFLTEDPFYTCCDGFFFDGVMDEIRIYNRTLSEREIFTLFDDANSVTVAEKPAFKIFPNPANDYLNIIDEEKQVKYVLLRTMDGKTVLSKPFESPLVLPFLPAGIFLLELIGKDNKLLKLEKIIIINKQRV